jgi:hypothetical protein
MDTTGRRELARRALAGVNGPGATTRATARALAKVDDAAAVVLVEGLSDQIAVETAAVSRGRNLDGERVLVLPMGGAHAIGRFLTRLGPLGAGVRLAGLCDLREEEMFRRGLVAAQVGSPRTRTDMERLGFYVCVDDLEDELIRILGSRSGRGSHRLAGRRWLVPLVAAPAGLARPGARRADAAVPGQRWGSQAPLRPAPRGGGGWPGCPAPAAGGAARRRVTGRDRSPPVVGSDGGGGGI